VNPNHLFLGTAKENTCDAAEKGRMPNGKNHHRSRAILTETEVMEIFKSNKPTRALAIEYAVGRRTIEDIQNRKTWVWLTQKEKHG